MRDAYERIIAARQRGLYESNYLKANSPDGERAFWIKHNALVPIEGDGIAEFWVILFQRGQRPVVAKRERPWSEVEAAADDVQLRSAEISLTRERARGRIADIEWDLALSEAGPPLWHLPYERMYRGSFPKKKLLTPAPNLHFHGTLIVGSERWEIADWVGLRGHNWGREHAHRYAYGSCNVWEDGSRSRAIDGFTAQIKLGRRTSPWLTALVGREPLIAKNDLRHWLGSGRVEPGRWTARWWRPSNWRGGGPVSVEFLADTASYAGLRYAHPDGRESYCYNTKFADVTLQAHGETFRSRAGELEVLYPVPLAGIPLHPSPGWKAEDGDYRSS